MLHLHLACFLFSQTMRAHSLDLVEASGSDNVFFDASTSVSRSESQIECALDVATCVRPTHGIYSVRLGRYLHAEELLACQGIWRIDSENMQVWDAMVKREKFAQNMAGNSFSATVCQANFLTCLIACDGWRELQPATPGTAATGNAKRQKIDCRQDVGDTAGTPSAAAGTSKSQPLLEKREDAKKTACLSGSQTIPTRRLRRKTTLVPVPRPKNPMAKEQEILPQLEKKFVHRSGKRRQSAEHTKKQLLEEIKKPMNAIKGMRGYFRSCMAPAKWARSRKAQQWTLVCSTAPALMKKYKEIPNSLRSFMRIPKLKYQPKMTTAVEQIHLPLPLQMVVEDMVMERIGLGEEVTVQYVKSTLVMCCEMWNTVVDSMKLSLRDRALAMIREQDAELAALNPQELDQKLNEFMTRTQRLLAPIRVSENDATLVPLDMFSQSFVKFCPKVLTVTLLKLTTHKLTYIHT
jgi:hypothetical protein